MRQILFIGMLAALTARPAHAEEEVRWKSLGTRAEFVILHDEGGAHYLESFVKARGAPQRLVETRIFRDPAAAAAAFRAATAGFSSTAPRWLSERGARARGKVKIWETRAEWNEEWEARFREWVRTTATATYFEERGLATDCADVAYAFRWIFARLNGLPAANHLVGSEELFTNETGFAAWAKLPTAAEWHQDARFRAALDYLLENTYTHALMRDSYPVAIRRNSVGPGAYFLNLHSQETGHTEFLRDVALEAGNPEPLRILASDVPRSVRRLADYGFRAPATRLEDGKVAFVRFRWPVLRAGARELLAAEAMPDYSLEQFAPGFVNGERDFAHAVIHRLLPDWQPNPAAALKSLVTQLRQRWADREQIVADGYAYCAVNDCRDGSLGWENWSTPSRDKATGVLVGLIDELYKGPACNSWCRWELSSHLRDPVVTVEGRRLAVGELLAIWRAGRFSSDPRLTVPERWGLR